MLKEVEANGQIALGERFAGRRYDLRFHADGRVEVLPVPVAQEPAAEASRPWARENAEAIEQYNGWACRRESYSQRVRGWRASQSD